VMLDTISQRNEDVLRTLIGVGAMGGTENMAPISMREMAAKTHYPFATIQRLMQDLVALQIVKRHGSGSVSAWTLSDYVLKEVKDAELYTQEDMKGRPTGRIRVIKRRIKEHRRFIRIPLGKVTIGSTGTKIVVRDNGQPAATTVPVAGAGAAGGGEAPVLPKSPPNAAK